MKVDTYTLRYDATDSNGRVAAPKARRVQVIDTRKPRITLNGEPEMQHNVTQAPDFKKVEFNDPMASCSDDCDQQITLSEPVWDRPWNDRVIGCYTRTYTCRDASSNSASATRRVCLQDHG